jgi:uncharacterized ferredoxin-like protein
MEKKAALNVAYFMAAASRTAPKTRGVDNVVIAAIDDTATRNRVIKKMKEIAKRDERPSMARDAKSIANSPVLIVIGVKANAAGLNCSFCGFGTCDELEKSGGTCAYNSIDLGIAMCSAAEVANHFHIDNRVMYSIGKACLELRMFGPEVKQALGIPLSITGKNPFFDRKS